MEPWLFGILDTVDSTNNYAMAKIHAGLAKHGQAWFSQFQESGKGQRGKQWLSNRGENILMSICIKPPGIFNGKAFFFNAAIANTCIEFLKRLEIDNLFIKWPNDLYWGDRKAGGILIENTYQDKKWNWAIAGIGINVNQLFDPNHHPVSIQMITGKKYDPVDLARKLHMAIMKHIEGLTIQALPGELIMYNENLYKRNKEVQLRKGNQLFHTTVKQVNEYGQLITSDVMERSFEFGDAEWIISR